MASISARQEDIVFLSGSRCEGWSNRGSNYNIYVICESFDGIESNAAMFVPGAGPRIRVHLGHFGGQGLTVQYWLRADVESSREAFNLHALTPNVEFWPRLTEFFHRIRVGEPLQNAAEFEAFRGRIDFQSFEEAVARFLMRGHEAYAHDALWVLREGLVDDAVLMAQLSLDQIVDAYCVLRGQTNPHPKWRFRRLQAISPTGALVRRYREALALSSRPAAVAGQVEARLWLAETLSVCSQLGWNYDDLEERRGRAGGGRIPRRRLDAKFKANERGDRAIFLFGGGSHRLNEAMTALWTIIDGRRSEGEISRTIARCYGLTATEASATVADSLTSLEAIGLLAQDGRPAWAVV